MTSYNICNIPFKLPGIDTSCLLQLSIVMASKVASLLDDSGSTIRQSEAKLLVCIPLSSFKHHRLRGRTLTTTIQQRQQCQTYLMKSFYSQGICNACPGSLFGLVFESKSTFQINRSECASFVLSILIRNPNKHFAVTRPKLADGPQGL